MWPSKTVRRIRPVAVSGVVAILAFLDASILSAVAQETAGDEQVNAIEEIIVTARRREESLLDRAGFGFGLQ